MSRPSLAAVRAAAEAGVKEAAEAILKAARENAPVDEGDLRESGDVTMSGMTATITFDEVYAKKQHEDMRLQHPGGGGPKFLERAMGSERTRARQIIADHIRRSLGG